MPGNYFRYLISAGLFMGLFLFPACDKDSDDEIPFAIVNFYIYPNSILYSEINSPGGSIYLFANQPSRGILVYRIDTEEFMAYERTCPHDPTIPEAIIEVEPSIITAFCPVCNTKYLLLDGSRFDGPGRRSLKRYQTSYDGNTLHIYN